MIDQGAGGTEARRAAGGVACGTSVAGGDGWIYIFQASGWAAIRVAIGWTVLGVIAFLIWARAEHVWPFGPKEISEEFLAAQPRSEVLRQGRSARGAAGRPLR